MLSTVAIVFLDSFIWAMAGGNLSPVPEFALLFLAGLINFGFCLPRADGSEILPLIAAISGSICLLFAFAGAPFLFKLIVLALVAGIGLIFTRRHSAHRFG
jgi:hypothetical protein